MKSFCKVQILLFCGIFFATLSVITYAFLPAFLENLILKNFILTPHSASFQQWKKAGIPIYTKFYLFNITNPEAVLNGTHPPILQEVGPFTYKQELEKQNITWVDDDSVQYRVIKRWIYDPKKSPISENSEIYHYNVPLMSAIAQIGDIQNTEERYTSMESLNSLVEAFRMKLIRKDKIKELMFDGYDDDLLKVAAQFFPKVKPPKKFAFFYGRNDTSTDGVYTAFTGQKDNGLSLGLLKHWHLTDKLRLPTEHDCVSIKHISAGDFQVPFFRKYDYHFLEQFSAKQWKPDPLYMFIGDMCRAFRLDYKNNHKFMDVLQTYRYHSGPKQFDYRDVHAQCYCHSKTCPPNGVYHLNDCAKGAPIYISHPHFLYGDASLLKQVHGLSPSVKEHEFFVDYAENLAIPVNLNIRLQVNLFVKKNSDVEIMQHLPDDYQFYLPQLWTSTHVNIDEELATQLSVLNETIPVALFILAVIFSLLAVLFFLISMTIVISSNMLCRTTNVIHYESVDMVSQIDPKDITVSSYGMDEINDKH